MRATGGPSLVVVVLGAFIGVSAAVLLQQAGTLPLDRLAAFGLAGAGAGAALVLLVVRRGFARRAVDWIAVVIVVLLLVVAVSGIAAASGEGPGGASGYIDGGCTVEAVSSSDATVVTDTSRSDPFDVLPDDQIAYVATSPAPIRNHTWKVWVDVGGFRVPAADSGDENADLDERTEDVVDVASYADRIESRLGGPLAGIFLVGGDISGEGGACEGQAWVRFPGEMLASNVGRGASGLLVVLVIVLLVVLLRPGPRAALAGPQGPPDDTFTDGFESGDTSAWTDGP